MFPNLITLTLVFLLDYLIVLGFVNGLDLEEFERQYPETRRSRNNKDDPDIAASFETLVKHHGDTFQFETHNVTTDDDYILTVYRIQLNQNSSSSSSSSFSSNQTNRKPVILLHGFMGIATNWIINSPFLYASNNNSDNSSSTNREIGDNLGYNLALTNRYDVWIPDLRGNANKPPLTTKDKKFWRFSFEQIALSDIPAVIRFAMARAGTKTVGLVGFSLGTTCTFILLSMKPEYADIIQPFIALAPVYFLHHVDVPLFSILAPLTVSVCGEDGEFSYTGPFHRNDTILLCKYDWFMICPRIINGYHINRTRIPVIVSQIAASTSNQNICHLDQWFMSKRLARYDFGSIEKDCEKYHQVSPPIFPLQNISSRAKIALISAQDDVTATPGDIDSLRNVLVEQVGLKLIANHVITKVKCSHLDLLFGTGAGKWFHTVVIDILDKYTQ